MSALTSTTVTRILKQGMQARDLQYPSVEWIPVPASVIAARALGSLEQEPRLFL